MVDSMQTPPAASPTPTGLVNASTSAPLDPNTKSILLVITYLIPIVFIYTMIKKSDKPFFVWHSKNAAAYLLVILSLTVLFNILWAILPSLVVILSSVLNLLYLVFFLLIIYLGIVKGSWIGKQTSIPVLTNIGQKLPLEKWFNTGAKAAAPEASSTPTPPMPAAPAAPATPSSEQTPPTPPIA